MKKVIVCILAAVMLVNCELKVKDAKANQTSVNISCNTHYYVTYEKVIKDGIEYAIFSSTNYYGMSPFVINLTKEKLEIELLRVQLNELNQNK